MRELEIALMYQKTSNKGTDQFGKVNKIEDIIEEQPKLDLLVGSEWYFLHPCSRPLSYSEKNYLIQAFRNISESHPAIIMPGTIAWEQNGFYRNTAYVFHQGKVIFKYDKHYEGADRKIWKPNQLKYAKGSVDGRFRRNGILFGLEICADHGSLKDCGERVDIQIITSCGMWINPNDTYARKGGYVLLSDGYYPEASVCKCERERIDFFDDQAVDSVGWEDMEKIDFTADKLEPINSKDFYDYSVFTLNLA